MKKTMISRTSYRNLINFIPETETNNTSCIKATKSPNNESNCQGQEVKSFYEDLLKEETYKDSIELPHQTNRKSRSAKRKKISTDLCHQISGARFLNSHSIDPCQRQHFKLLQYSQLGDEKMVEDLLDQGLNVNFTDFYGWTALMCAAQKGHSNVIKMLIQYGADRNLFNSSGDTALSLAKCAGHSSSAIIIGSCPFKETHTEHSDQDSSSEVFHCDICKRNFNQKEACNHKTSTLHLFNSGFHTKGPVFQIPDSNRGFQMMLRSGWDAKSGLGPDGTGSKYPVKTLLKQDRAGVGDETTKRKKAKVTHFDRDDVKAVKSQKGKCTRQISVRKAAQNAARYKERREKRWEQHLRLEMN